MKNRIIKLLPYAENAIEQLFKRDNDNRIINPDNPEIDKEYKGYISSFGAAVMQSGLLPAIYFNHQSEGSGKDRKKLMQVIFEVIKLENNIHFNGNLLKYAKQNTVDLKQLEKQILDAATAVKLVIRTYKLT